jgi:hypothetical protein
MGMNFQLLFDLAEDIFVIAILVLFYSRKEFIDAAVVLFKKLDRILLSFIPAKDACDRFNYSRNDAFLGLGLFASSRCFRLR